MQTLEFRNDTLIEIGTFLARRWSENENITIEFSEKSEAKTRIKDNRIILTRAFPYTVLRSGR